MKNTKRRIEDLENRFGPQKSHNPIFIFDPDSYEKDLREILKTQPDYVPSIVLPARGSRDFDGDMGDLIGKACEKIRKRSL
jgi:hypothetical protein